MDISKADALLNWKTVTLMVAAFIGVCQLLAMPIGDFPLNDDWTFAVSVKNLVDTGKLTITAWTLAGSMFSILSAAIICKIVGFSFHALRIYNFILALSCVFATSFLTRAVGASWWSTLFSAVVISSNPLFFCLMNSFMMDVPTASLLCTSVLFLFLSWHREGKARLAFTAAGSLLAMLSASNREITILFPVAYLIFGLMLNYLKKSKHLANYRVVSLLESAAPLTVSSIAIMVHSWWIVNVTGVPFCMKVEQTYLAQSMGSGPLPYLITCFFTLVRLLIYMGLILLPLSAMAAPRLLSQLKGKQANLVTALTIELVLLLPAALLFSKNIMPLGDNLIYDFGLGPMILTLGESATKLPADFTAPSALWTGVTVFSGVGLALSIGCLAAVILLLQKHYSESRWTHKHSVVALLLLFCAIYTVVLSGRGFFDRYLILLLLPLSVILNFKEKEPANAEAHSKTRLANVLRCMSVTLAATSAAVLAFYSVAGTRDYFEWNRARWSLLDSAVKSLNLAPEDVDGGYEFNGWYVYEPGNKFVDVTKNDHRENNNKNVLSVVELPGYRTVQRENFDSIFWGNRTLYFQQKISKE